MPHATVSARDEYGRRCCPYCGRPLRDVRQTTCGYCRDLPALEPLDDRYALTETGDGGDEAKP